MANYSEQEMAERLETILGPKLAKMTADYVTLLKIAEDTDNPDHPIFEQISMKRDNINEESHGRLSGTWRVERYDAPIEYYAEKLVGGPVANFHQLPVTIRTQADIDMKRNHKPMVTEFEEVFENLFTTQGVSTLWNQAANGGTTNSGASVPGQRAWYNNAQAVIGVGDSSTAAANTQFDLQAVTNRLWVAMDATFPTLPATSSNAIVFRSTFGSAQANYAWQEFAV